MLGTIQRDKLAKIAKHLTDDGFLQRVMVLTPPPVELEVNDDIDGSFDEEAIKNYDRVIQKLVAYGGGQPMRVTEEAKAWRLKLRERLTPIINLGYYPSVLTGAVSKWNGLWARVAAVYELIHQADLGTDRDDITLVSGDAGQWAHNFIINCVEPNAANFYLNLLGVGHEYSDPMISIAGWLITSAPRESVTRREVQRASGRANRSRDEIVEIMQSLKDRGWVETADLDKRLKPNKWRVNPRIYTDLLQRKEQEVQRRAEIRRKIESSAGEGRREK